MEVPRRALKQLFQDLLLCLAALRPASSGERFPLQCSAVLAQLAEHSDATIPCLFPAGEGERDSYWILWVLTSLEHLPPPCNWKHQLCVPPALSLAPFIRSLQCFSAFSANVASGTDQTSQAFHCSCWCQNPQEAVTSRQSLGLSVLKTFA